MKYLFAILLLGLTSCAYNDHSRTFVQYTFVCDDGYSSISTEVLLDKSGIETSKADNQPEITPEFTIPLVP